ncbi:uncharacterized protein LOC122432429 [Cervus canadensis]|uniref:uncharacterized protein LOC122432429 n=1 Tax=Cervus canadensis TaxID=1574408 RepID=UPI001CA30307|nr:uncharacterized protein LOC122432429 [Cervus canadensis]
MSIRKDPYTLSPVLFQGIWVSTYLFTVCFAANVGLLFGVVCTVAIVIGHFPRAKTLSTKNMKEMEFKMKTEIDDETLQQVKIISINNPLVFLNAKKFHTDIMNIIQKENTGNQPLDEIRKYEQSTLLTSLSGICNEEATQPCLNPKCSLILDCSGLTFSDYSGVSMVVEGQVELWKLRGEHSDRCVRGKAERVQHRNRHRPAFPNLSHSTARPPTVAGGWVLRRRLQGSDPRRGLGLTAVDTLRGRMLGHRLGERPRWGWPQLRSATPEGFGLAATKAHVSARARTGHGSGLQPQRRTHWPATERLA